MKKYLLFLTGMVIVIAIGCSKNKSLIPEAANTKITTVDVGTLKSFLASMFSLDESKVSYNASSQKFVVFEREQISLEELSALFQLAKRVCTPNYYNEFAVKGKFGAASPGW